MYHVRNLTFLNINYPGEFCCDTPYIYIIRLKVPTEYEIINSYII